MPDYVSNRRLRFPRAHQFTREIEQLVPGGAHTYSRGRDQFPQESPSGIVKGKGAWVWDIDGNRLLDWSMGLTSVSLGHADERVNAAVVEAIANGVNFQRPSQLELDTARLFLDVVGTDMVKFARHGSSVTTAAVKLARAYTGRAKIAVAAEHPFFSFDDWFIGSTPTDFGIPQELKKFTLKFSYGSIDSLHALLRAHGDDIACVLMEPVKFDLPPEGYLNEVEALCRTRGVVFILDEMITGLKIAMPGAAKYFDVKPRLSTWGKGIGNGFACAALTGDADIMRLGALDPEGQRKLFLLSSTHGSESVGLAAMSATLKIFSAEPVIEGNWSKGRTLASRLNALIVKHRLERHLLLKGLPPLMLLDVRGPDGNPDETFRTLFLQEMIANGVLFQGLFCLTPSHGERELVATVDAFDEACTVFKQAIAAGTAEVHLSGPPTRPVFRKFN